MASLVKYERHDMENPRLTRCEDPLILDAIQYLEHERSRAASHLAEKR